MSGVNKVILIGRLGKDPEVSHTPAGVAVAKFTVATSENWKDKNTGEKKELTEWHRCVAWRRLGEICGKYLHKGSQVYIEGKLSTRSWDKDGTKHYATEIVVGAMQMLDARRDSSSSRPDEPPPEGGPDDEIPF